MNNKGFISTSVIYTLLIVFLLMLMMLLMMYFNNRVLLNTYKSNLRDEMYTEYTNMLGDIIIYTYALKSGTTSTYELVYDTEVVSLINSTTCKYYETGEEIDESNFEVSIISGKIDLKVKKELISNGKIECEIYYKKG